jgi:hypothetical protein
MSATIDPKEALFEAAMLLVANTIAKELQHQEDLEDFNWLVSHLTSNYLLWQSRFEKSSQTVQERWPQFVHRLAKAMQT